MVKEAQQDVWETESEGVKSTGWFQQERNKATIATNRSNRGACSHI